jgi:hypothetical protein
MLGHLSQALREADPEVRARAARAVASLHRREHAAVLAGLARDDPDRAVRLAAIDGLGRLGDEEARRALDALLDDGGGRRAEPAGGAGGGPARRAGAGAGGLPGPHPPLKGAGMAVLIFQAADGFGPAQGWPAEKEFAGELTVGAAPGNGLRLPPELGVAPRHALVTRSAVYHVPVLVHLAGESAPLRVNGRRVVRLRALRHQDRIELGRARLLFVEVALHHVAAGSPLRGKKCLVCGGVFVEGDEVVPCPRPHCRALHHARCWVTIPICSEYACGYPVEELIRRVLARWLAFEKLERESELVKEQKLCAHCTRRHRVPFQPEETAVRCPRCAAPYHVECWFQQDACPAAGCGYDVAALIRAALAPGAAPAPAPVGRGP